MKKKMILQVLVFLRAAVLTGPAEDITYPLDARVINVKTAYGAFGDGITDDTAAIQNAITANAGTHGKILYFPNGTYLVSATLSFGTVNVANGLTLQGQSQAGTIIKLMNSTPGFTASGSPKNVIETWTYATGVTNNQAFGNNILNLTIDTGTGNGGAVGLAYHANNYGSVRDVTIKSTDTNKIGITGLSMKLPWPGPCMIQRVTITGFNYGISISQSEYGATLENVTLNSQITAGILNTGSIVSLNNLTSSNTVPALVSDGAGSLSVVTNANCTGGSSARSALEITSGKCLLHAVTASGYQSAVKNGTSVVSGLVQTDYVNNAVLSLFPSPAATLNLPIAATQEPAPDDLTNWVSVEAYGANGSDSADDTAGIQAAIDSGKTTVYFPNGIYYVNDTIYIRNGVKRLDGLGSGLKFTTALIAKSVPIFQLESSAAAQVMFERFNTDFLTGQTPSFTFFKHNSASTTLILRNLGINAGQAYASLSGAGPLFIEDVAGSSWQFNNQFVWARQLNPEVPRGYTKIVNDGGYLWILGLKTEKDDTVIETKTRGKTELLGGLLYPAGTVDAAKVAFINNNGSFSASIAGSSYASGNFYTTWVTETRDSSTLSLSGTSVPSRTNGKILPLYTGYVLPGLWKNGDIGAVAAPGSPSYDLTAKTITINGSGSDITGTSDEFHYVYQPITGDATIVARVASGQNTNTLAKAGVMFRETLDAGSKFAFLSYLPNTSSNEIRWMRRSSTGGGVTTTNSNSTNQYLKVKRVGNVFTSYVSGDGVTYTQVGSSATISMASIIWVGLAVTSRSDGTLCSSVFDTINVTQP